MADRDRCIRQRLGRRVDGLSALLDGPRARRAFLLRILLDPPWSVRLEDEAPLSVTDGGPGSDVGVPRRRGAGPPRGRGRRGVGRRRPLDASPTTPARPTQVVIHPGQVCTTVDGHVVVEEMSAGRAQLGQQRRGGDGAADGRLPAGGRGDATAAPGPAPHDGAARRRARHAAHRPARRRGGPRRPGPGGRPRPVARPVAPHPAAHVVRAVALRAPGWYAAQGDAVVGPALRLMQHHPDHPWSVAELADRSGCRGPASRGGSPSSSASRRWRS